jgi:hypothetical protein
MKDDLIPFVPFPISEGEEAVFERKDGKRIA